MLILFDIDGTLLLGTPRAHTTALARALGDVYGVAVTRADVVAVRPAGRTDQEIARLVLRARGVPDADITAGLPAWMARAADVYPAIDAGHPDPPVAPGAAEALARVAAGPAGIALLTGNLEPIAHAKMARAGLARWFARGRGAFGSDHERRDALVPIAVAREAAPVPAVVVGDTPRDIACARAAGARCVAVTTGAYSAGDLSAADAVVPGLAAAAGLAARAPAQDDVDRLAVDDAAHRDAGGVGRPGLAAGRVLRADGVEHRGAGLSVDDRALEGGAEAGVSRAVDRDGQGVGGRRPRRRSAATAPAAGRRQQRPGAQEGGGP